MFQLNASAEKELSAAFSSWNFLTDPLDGVFVINIYIYIFGFFALPF